MRVIWVIRFCLRRRRVSRLIARASRFHMSLIIRIWPLHRAQIKEQYFGWLVVWRCSPGDNLRCQGAIAGHGTCSPKAEQVALTVTTG